MAISGDMGISGDIGLLADMLISGVPTENNITRYGVYQLMGSRENGRHAKRQPTQCAVSESGVSWLQRLAIAPDLDTS